RRAREQRKPLLVLVVPEGQLGREERGRLFGGLLRVCDEETLAILTLCEFVCATAQEARESFEGATLAGEPLALLVESGEARPRIRLIDPRLPPEVLGWGSEREAMDASAYVRIAMVADAVRAAVAGERRTLSRRAEVAREGLSSRDLATLTEIANGEAPIRFPICDRGAAILLELAEKNPGRRPRVFEALRRAAYGRLLAVPPPGAEWVKTSGCAYGSDMEANPMYVVLCGMGYIPGPSRRFLRLLTNA
ncbi:MAG: hypothetical protein ACREIU_03170, partial [Planctomycetota bacterium]